MANKREIMEDARDLIEYAKTLGVTEVSVKDSSRRKAQGSEEKPRVTSDKRQATSDETLDDIRKDIGECKRCKLCTGRTNIVFGVGNPDAELMFIGEGPGADEDTQGIPFVGRAGQLLTKIIEAMGFKRNDVYIANIVKCRPPGNRNPEPDEVRACIPFLIRQVGVLRPKIIVCLGSVATQNLLGTEEKITRLRGNFTKWQNVPVMPTYHPAFLLRNPNMKKPVWEDMQLVIEFLKKQ